MSTYCELNKNDCIKQYKPKGPIFNQSRNNLAINKCPCLFTPVEQYYDTFYNLFNSNWSEINFYMFKSGIGANKLLGELDINHAGVVFEIKNNQSYKYFLLAEVEIGDENNKVGHMLSSVFPSVNTKTKTINWNSHALILAGEICIKYLNITLNNINNPQERLNIVLQNCHLSLGGADEPIPLLLLKNNNNNTVKKLHNIIKVIKRFREKDLSYIFIGCKSVYPDYKTGNVVTGYSYTCETFASLISSYIYREFENEILNNKYLYNFYNQLLLPVKSERYQGFNNNIIKGRYKNEQIFFKFLRPGFLNNKTQKLESVVGIKWNDLTQIQKDDCYKFYFTMHNILINNLSKFILDFKQKNISKIINDFTDIIKKLDNFWIRCYSSQNYLDQSEPTYFSFPLKNNILLDDGSKTLTKYEYQNTIIENLITMTMSDVTSGLDFDPFINLDLINKNIKFNNNNLNNIFIICIILILLLILFYFFVINYRKKIIY